MNDENFNIEDELDHFKHVSAIRASKIARLKKQLKDAESVIDFVFYASYSSEVEDLFKNKAREYKQKYKGGNNE